MMQRRIDPYWLCAALLCAPLCIPAQAAVVDLVSGSSGSANGTLYMRDDAQGTGTGEFNSFLRLQNNVRAGVEQGYNADYGSTPERPFNEKVGVWTHSVQFSDLHGVKIDGLFYYEFLLDLDEPNSAPKSAITLDSVMIFNSGATALSAPFSDDLSTLGTKLYDMDVGADGDTLVTMDGARTHGNGQSDMAMYILAGNFAGVGADDYITFYSLLSGINGSFEEWGLRTNEDTEVPVPGTLGLFGIGLLGLGLVRLRSR